MNIVNGPPTIVDTFWSTKMLFLNPDARASEIEPKVASSHARDNDVVGIFQSLLLRKKGNEV